MTEQAESVLVNFGGKELGLSNKDKTVKGRAQTRTQLMSTTGPKSQGRVVSMDQSRQGTQGAGTRPWRMGRIWTEKWAWHSRTAEPKEDCPLCRVVLMLACLGQAHVFINVSCLPPSRLG